MWIVLYYTPCYKTLIEPDSLNSIFKKSLANRKVAKDL